MLERIEHFEQVIHIDIPINGRKQVIVISLQLVIKHILFKQEFVVIRQFEVAIHKQIKQFEQFGQVALAKFRLVVICIGVIAIHIKWFTIVVQRLKVGIIPAINIRLVKAIIQLKPMVVTTTILIRHIITIIAIVVEDGQPIFQQPYIRSSLEFFLEERIQ